MSSIEGDLEEFKTIQIDSSEDANQIVFIGKSPYSETIFLATADKNLELGNRVGGVMISPKDAKEVVKALLKLIGE